MMSETIPQKPFRYAVVYYSYSGNCARIAMKIAAFLRVTPIRMTDSIRWRGGFYWNRVRKARKGQLKVNAQLSRPLGEYDLLVAVAPVWYNRIVPTMEQFLDGIPREKVHLVARTGGLPNAGQYDYASVDVIAGRLKNEDAVVYRILRPLMERSSLTPE